jgi:hypothetical protein
MCERQIFFCLEINVNGFGLFSSIDLYICVQFLIVQSNLQSLSEQSVVINSKFINYDVVHFIRFLFKLLYTLRKPVGVTRRTDNT